MAIITYIKRVKSSITDVRTEEGNLIRFVRKLSEGTALRILDVGCGYGRNTILLQNLGYTVTGVEANESIVAANIASNRICLTVEQFDKTTDLYDVILMSHIIEHFYPQDLLPFMEHYLDRLRAGGYLIVSAPLNSPYFYDDFDHIRPYSPVGIHMVFGGSNSQVQYYAKNILDLQDIWFRKSPLRFIHFKGRFLNGQHHLRLANILLAVLFRLSFQLIGRTDGWMGLYRKR